jgi:large subunit ribosomal protein L23
MRDRLIIKPVISEKATTMAEDGKYVFHVRPETTKIDVKHLVKELYGVDVDTVRVVNHPAKFRTVGRGRSISKRKPYKRAIVTTKGKKSIDLYKVNDLK